MEEKLNEAVLAEEDKKEDTVSAENVGEETESEEYDYEKIIEEDLEVLRSLFPEISEITDITELENPERYAALRDLGLSQEEAYRATTKKVFAKHDTRAHLRSSAPKGAGAPRGTMSYRDMETARELFPGISDAEIQRLYKKVTR